MELWRDLKNAIKREIDATLAALSQEGSRIVIVEPGDNIIGKWVRVKSCEAVEHGDNDGCVCHLKGKTVVIERRYDTPFVGTPSYHIAGMTQRVRRSEVTLIRRQKRSE